jgi:autotransporter family porin
MRRVLVARFASALVAAVVLSGAAFAALVNASAPDAKAVVTPVPVPVFGMSPKAFLPLVLVPSSKFTTLPPGSALPSDAQCAARVQHKPENKRVNVTYNATPGDQQLGSDVFSGDDPRAYTEIGIRVTGHFSGTTDEILQWAACKWGVDEDIVRAQAALESWWHQDAKGDWGTDSDRCPPGHGLGVDDPVNHPDTCPESWGLLQIRYPYQVSAWPGMANSSAFEADTAYAIWRACYEGYEGWLNQVDRGRDYGPGDVWGCVGRWYAGRWHTSEAEYYIGRVKDYLNSRIWEQPNFQEQ